eukprot:scaffold14435_cov19-Tisochrysis_lutea.AAC.2
MPEKLIMHQDTAQARSPQASGAAVLSHRPEQHNLESHGARQHAAQKPGEDKQKAKSDSGKQATNKDLGLKLLEDALKRIQDQMLMVSKCLWVWKCYGEQTLVVENADVALYRRQACSCQAFSLACFVQPCAYLQGHPDILVSLKAFEESIVAAKAVAAQSAKKWPFVSSPSKAVCLCVPLFPCSWLRLPCLCPHQKQRATYIATNNNIGTQLPSLSLNLFWLCSCSNKQEGFHRSGDAGNLSPVRSAGRAPQSCKGVHFRSGSAGSGLQIRECKKCVTSQECWEYMKEVSHRSCEGVHHRSWSAGSVSQIKECRESVTDPAREYITGQGVQEGIDAQDADSLQIKAHTALEAITSALEEPFKASVTEELLYLASPHQGTARYRRLNWLHLRA